MRTQIGRTYKDGNRPNWSLDSGSGTRTADYYIKFERTYRRPPEVIASISGMDTNHARNARLTTDVMQVGREGFVLRFRTWADTIVYGAGASWMSVPKVGEEADDVSIVDVELDLNGVET